MSNTIFHNLLVGHVESFIYEFSNTARNLFFDHESGRLRHPGEYGSYREHVVKGFLRFMVPRSIDLHDGFIITNKGNTSTQCDIILFDKNITPLYQDGEKQTFFPIESVAGAGEVKSTLSRAGLIEALKKLHSIKRLSEDLDTRTIVRQVGAPRPEYKNIFTFIICKNLEFEFRSLPDIYDSAYEGMDSTHKHNMILSIDDGVALYTGVSGGGMRPEQSFSYSVWDGQEAKPRFISPDSNRYIHFQLFCSYLFMMAASKVIYYPEFVFYTNPVDGGKNWDVV